MPPSGYNRTQSCAVSQFLRSCFDSLLVEATEKKMSLTEALNKECENIKRVLRLDPASVVAVVAGGVEEATLNLTLQFYQGILARSVGAIQSAPAALAEEVLESFEDRILAIHVPPSV